MEGDRPDQEFNAPIGDYYLWNEIQVLRRENEEFRERVTALEQQALKVKRNTRNIDGLRVVLIVVLGAMAIASAWDVGEGNTRTFHGERWQAIVVTLVGALGVGALGFGDKLKDNADS